MNNKQPKGTDVFERKSRARDGSWAMNVWVLFMMGWFKNCGRASVMPNKSVPFGVSPLVQINLSPLVQDVQKTSLMLYCLLTPAG